MPAEAGPEAIEELCQDESLLYLSEMMNFPGVIQRDPEVIHKLVIARAHGRRIDGHAPGLRCGALASSVAHDCHNIVAVDASDADLARAVNLVIANRGGISLTDGDTADVLELPVAGLMSDGYTEDAAAGYVRLTRLPVCALVHR